ncbi:hypothetical protein HanRHA438_Chr10g0462681 [Helianthus annuus]|nr:hypothetical protein HanIR_Chr10g0485261 [Helianthus annuus]KAJ0880401.1 hypothetical protein HanRHA438_Chr10g0462681 [Helianthus annuus]
MRGFIRPWLWRRGGPFRKYTMDVNQRILLSFFLFSTLLHRPTFAAKRESIHYCF